MRKLSKKISMLMVLAMLVGLFSGVVSASAASAWSFKSSKYAVAVGESINMESNEYADFDLLKDGAAPAGYTVEWASSDADVVWVNAKTGQLRADKFGKADDGDKAVISATFTNTATGNKATRSFTIELGAAKAPAYKLEAPAFEEAVEVGAEVKFSTNVLDAAGNAVPFKTCKLYRAYFLDGKAVDTTWTAAAAGEYTFTVGAFTAKADTADLAKAVLKAEFTVVVGAAVDNSIVSASQTSMYKALLVLGSEAAAKAVADSKNVDVTFVAENSSYDIEALVKGVSVDANNKSAVVVEMYDQFIPKYTYKFAVGDESKGFVAVTAGEEDIASISVVTWKKYIAETYNNLEVQVFNAQGIDITASKEVQEYLAYYLDWEVVDTDAGVDILNGQIQFFEANKSAVVKAILNMGYNEDGTEKVDLTASGKIVSVSRYADQPSVGFVITDKADNNDFNPAHWDYNYTLNTIELIADEMPGKLVAKYVETEEKFGWTQNHDCFVINGEDTGLDGKGGYTYRSSNEEVCFIDAEDGTVYPSKAGTAKLYVIDPDGAAIGSVAVKVYAEQTLKNFTASLSKDKLSVDTKYVDDSIILTVNAKDQLDRAYRFDDADLNGETWRDIDFEWEFSEDFDVDGVAKPYVSNIEKSNDDYKLTISVDADAIEDKTAKSTIIIKAWDADDAEKTKVITRKFTFSLKDVDDSMTGKEYLVSNDKTVDTKLNQWGAGAYKVDLSAELRDSKNYFLDPIAYTLKNNGDPITTTGAYTLVATKNNDDVPTALEVFDELTESDVIVNEFTTFIGTDENGALCFFPVLNAGSEVKKVSKGTYRFKLYVGTGNGTKLVDSLTISVKDTTEKFTAVRNNTNLASYHSELTVDTADGWGNLRDYVKLYRDGALYDDWKYSVVDIDIDDTRSVDGESIYVQDVTYQVSAFNEYGAYQSWSRAEYEYITVPVNMKFTILD